MLFMEIAVVLAILLWAAAVTIALCSRAGQAEEIDELRGAIKKLIIKVETLANTSAYLEKRFGYEAGNNWFGTELTPYKLSKWDALLEHLGIEWKETEEKGFVKTNIKK